MEQRCRALRECTNVHARHRRANGGACGQRRGKQGTALYLLARRPHSRTIISEAARVREPGRQVPKPGIEVRRGTGAICEDHSCKPVALRIFTEHREYRAELFGPLVAGQPGPQAQGLPPRRVVHAIAHDCDSFITLTGDEQIVRGEVLLEAEVGEVDRTIGSIDDNRPGRLLGGVDSGRIARRWTG